MAGWHSCDAYHCPENVRPYHIAITETAKANHELAEAELEVEKTAKLDAAAKLINALRSSIEDHIDPAFD